MSKLNCPDCHGKIMPTTQGWRCTACNWTEKVRTPRTEPTPEAPSIPPQEPPAKRIRTSDAVNDIQNAFSVWRSQAFNAQPFDKERHRDSRDANDQVDTWLEQVQAEQRQLRAAMLTCQAMVAVTNYGDMDAVHRARKLAMDVIAEEY